MSVPKTIGRYEIVRRLGKSMTDVYLAIDTEATRRVALKLVPINSASELVLEAERRGAAIQQELRALDPRMVEIYEYGDCDGWFFVAMQYVEGKSLAEVLRTDRSVDPVRAATIALEICEQLVKLHTCEPAVVHGDIKPSNVHLGMSDTVRLLDFGIAKTLRVDGDDTNHNFGSPSYCSPERLSRASVNPHADLWSVGATLYEMLAGVPPYQAESTRKLESLIRSGRAPRALPSSCPVPLQAIVEKALAPDPEERYGSAREFQADLQAFLEHKVTVAETTRRPRRMRSASSSTSSSTLEAARALLTRATRTMARAKEKLTPKSAVAWFALGMALWIVGVFARELWKARHPAATARPVETAKLPPVTAVVPDAKAESNPDLGLPALYASEGKRILDAYRSSSDPSLHDFDWQKAEVCLERAAELGERDDATLGALSLSRGYAALERLSGGRYSTAAAGQMRTYARDQFTAAALKTPQSPDPHLALARVYIYSMPDRARALRELEEARQLGAVFGPRERREQSDAQVVQVAARKPVKVASRKQPARIRRWR